MCQVESHAPAPSVNNVMASSNWAVAVEARGAVQRTACRREGFSLLWENDNRSRDGCPPGIVGCAGFVEGCGLAERHGPSSETRAVELAGTVFNGLTGMY